MIFSLWVTYCHQHLYFSSCFLHESRLSGFPLLCFYLLWKRTCEHHSSINVIALMETESSHSSQAKLPLSLPFYTHCWTLRGIASLYQSINDCWLMLNGVLGTTYWHCFWYHIMIPANVCACSISQLSDGGASALLEWLLAILWTYGRCADTSVSKEEQSNYVENTVRQNQASNCLM